MKFSSAPDDEDGMIFRRVVSENNLVEIGIFKVLFGFRVRSGFVGNLYYHLDWCGGGSWSDVQELYSIAHAILSKREENKNCFAGLPSISIIKPYKLDKDFLAIVTDLAGNYPLLQLERI